MKNFLLILSAAVLISACGSAKLSVSVQCGGVLVLNQELVQPQVFDLTIPLADDVGSELGCHIEVYEK